MVDAKSGDMLWYAASVTTGTGADTNKLTQIADMKNSIPGRITVIDTDSDLFADRLYAADMGGRIFRFDITNGNSAKTLVTGGVLAELGQGQVVSPAVPDITQTRRFYNAPDVVLIQTRGDDPYYNIAIGSGYRGHPLSTKMVDRFYSLRDKAPFKKYTQAEYDSLPRIHDADLVDITADPNGTPVKTSDAGWKYLLGKTGQKVLASATTVNGVVLFSTFEPVAPSVKDPCRPRTLNRAYALSVQNGHPALDLNRDGKVDNSDVNQEVPMDGILGRINVGVLRGQLSDDLQSGKNPSPSPPTVCLAGMHVLGSCVQVNDSVRTYWRRDVDPAN
jgi:type IV pilus assembly protein PilY1